MIKRLQFAMQGVNIMQFCKEYNAATQDKIGTVIPVEITVYEVISILCSWVFRQRKYSSIATIQLEGGVVIHGVFAHCQCLRVCPGLNMWIEQ